MPSLVQKESDAYLQSISQQQEWSGEESALQLLILPAAAKDTLPEYAATPEYLDPNHCRLCLQSLSNTTLESHLAAMHPEHTPATYRREVIQKTCREWPQPISPQVLRSRLAAFKRQLCDAEFAMSPCASCARMKRRCKLFEVTFPARDSDEPPSWLPWNKTDWLVNRDAWYEKLDDIFDIEPSQLPLML